MAYLLLCLLLHDPQEVKIINVKQVCPSTEYKFYLHDKTSSVKGGRIGTSVPKFIIQCLTHYIIFSRSSPKDPMGTLAKEHT